MNDKRAMVTGKEHQSPLFTPQPFEGVNLTIRFRQFEGGGRITGL